MSNKPLVIALALSFACSAPALAQKIKRDDDKVKRTLDDGTVVKAKVDDDGSTKLKVKTESGVKIKSTTEPREGMEDQMEDRMEARADMQNSSGVMVGGALMTPTRDIVDNAVGSREHTTLVTALRSAGLLETLKGTGPYTVFAPTNSAFNKLPGGTMNKLMRADMKPKLTSVLTYHVVPGRYLAADLRDGQKLTTVEGETLTVVRQGDQVMLRDAKGGTATVTVADAPSKNGVTHVVDTVLMPTR